MRKVFLTVPLLCLLFCLAWLSLLQVQASDRSFCQGIREAWEALEGYPYVWGGSRFEHGGFDCSGAIFKVSKLIGKPVPRTTSRKYYLMTEGEDRNWKEAGCGWLIWWTLNPSRPFGHVGMHIEQPHAWQSGSSTGPVKISLIPGNFWDHKFEASKRFY